VAIVPADRCQRTADGEQASSGDHRRSLGRLGEQIAAAHLQRLGFAVIARNVRTRQGEIDLIAFDSRTLAFVEVKTRRTGGRGIHREQQPLRWLRPRQCARLRRLAVAWLAREGRIRAAAQTIRFDAIGVIVDHRDRLVLLEHLEGAW
jgi:putative endonuclease